MIGQNALIQIVFSGLSSVVSFLTLSLSARLFGPEIIGTLAYLLGLTGLIFAFSDLGFSRAHVYFTAVLKKASQTLGTFLRLKLGLLFISVLIATTLALINKTEFKGLFTIILIFELTSRYSESILITFEALQLALPQNLIRLISKIVKLVAVVFLGLKLSTILGYSITFAVEGLILLCLSFWLLRRFLPLKFDKSLAKKYLQYSLPFFAIMPLSYLQTNSLVVILRQFSSASEVGYYSASANLAGFIKTLYGAIMIFFFPKISSLFAVKDFKSIQRYADLTMKYLLMLFIPIFLVAFLLRSEIVTLVLGSRFSPAVPVFGLFLLGIFLLMLSAPYGNILYATKNHRSLVLVNLISLIITVLLSFLLVPNLGAQGSVLASISAWTFSGFIFLCLVKKRLKLNILPQLFRFVFPAILVILSATRVINYLKPIFVLKLALTMTALIIYLALLFLLKLINSKDIKYLKSLIKLR